MKKVSLTKKIWLGIYISLAKHLPSSYASKVCRKIRGGCAKHILKYCGTNVNIEKGAHFSTSVSLGDNSGIGIDCEIHGDVTIGNNVMMGPKVAIYTQNHSTRSIDTPMIDQGLEKPESVIIEDDVWIGHGAIILPGVTVKRGSVVGAGAVVTKTYPEYSVIVGNPAKVVKTRK